MNRKFILIRLLLGACFAFTVLQTTTGEAQECDSNPACVENCCEQCDSNPACVENCCPAEEPPHEPSMCGDVPCQPPANVTLDPNIDLRPPAPTGKRGKSINPQPLTGRQFNSSHKEDNAATAHRQNTGVNKPDIQGIEDRANRRPQSRTSTPLFIPPSGTQPEARVGRARNISCENIRAEISNRVHDIKDTLERFGTYGNMTILGQLAGACDRNEGCLQYEIENGDLGTIRDNAREWAREILVYIDDHCL
jgi:hypothetical protein